MDELRLECDIDPSNARMSIAKRHTAEGFMVACHELGSDAYVFLNKDQARQLRDWLNQYLGE